jgi:hypothetical protein
MQKLKFSAGNAKLKGIPSFNLPSGYACPFADKCLSKADRTTGKLQDGKNTEFRCFSASQENRFPDTRNQRWYNYDLIKGKTKAQMVEMIKASLPFNVRVIRLHVAGDFFNQTYFDAWMQVAIENPDTVFYAYTKSLTFWLSRLGQIPSNLRLTASKGGRHDHLIEKHGLKYAEVVYSEAEAKEKGLEIDHDDSHAYAGSTKPFGLLIHGTQPPKSKASKAKVELAKAGWTGYKRD